MQSLVTRKLGDDAAEGGEAAAQDYTNMPRRLACRAALMHAMTMLRRVARFKKPETQNPEQLSAGVIGRDRRVACLYVCTLSAHVWHRLGSALPLIGQPEPQ